MKKTQEFSGKDVETAVKTACDTLSISRKALKYEVISTGASGIFGIVGRKDAIIKVVLPQNNTETSEKDREGIRSMVDEAFGPNTRVNSQLDSGPSDRPDSDSSRKGAPVPSQKPAPAPKKKQPVTPVESKPVESKPVESTSVESTPVESKPVPADSPEKTDTEDPQPISGDAAAPADLEDTAAPEPLPVVEVTQESIDLGLETLQRIADLITEGASVEAETKRDHLTLKISGGNAGILIGRKGQTLDAMQFLTDKIINRKSEARVRVKVDVEGYIETRKSNLKHLAMKMAEKAKKTGKPATINQMSAQDRRIVHLTLKDDNRVRTQSMGDGYYRRLVIFPKKKSSFAGKKRFKR
ncbi:MAG: RNA-binding cell elongation regulator Jag/EloR [Desulfotignum sp.]|nr:RNA-binding cell elongation regulator Jag/EloR [Desulfotignum sp.]